MNIIYGVIWGMTLAAGASSLVALLWAVRRGQMRHWQRQANSIFDDERDEGGKLDDRDASSGAA